MQSGGKYFKLKRVYTPVTSGEYSSLMVAECKKHGLKPVCTEASECKDNDEVLFVPGFEVLAYGNSSSNNQAGAQYDKACTYGKVEARCYESFVDRLVSRSAEENPVFLCGKAGVGKCVRLCT